MWFVTGTDTGVGKTTVTRALAAALHKRGLRVGVCKPAEPGCARTANGELVPADAVLLREAAGSEQELDEVCPYRFEEPLAPAVAAERSGQRIEVTRLAGTIGAIAERHDVVLVEGAGGWLVPLASHLTFADLATKLGWPVVLVAANRLGALNHALLTVENLRMRGVELAGYIWNQPAALDDVAVQTNPGVLQAWLGEPLGQVPYLGGEPRSAAELAEVAEAHIDLAALLASWRQR